MGAIIKHHQADITLDFETYYAKDFSLKNLTYEEYIRDPQFEIIMCGFCIHSTGEKYYIVGEKEVWKELNRLEISRHSINGHNMHFDGMIVSDLLDFVPRDYYCTLTMAGRVEPGGASLSLANLAKTHRLKDKGDEVIMAMGKRLRDFSRSELAAYGGYCVGDCEITKDLYGIYRPHFSDQDMNTMSVTLRMHCDPFFDVDTELLVPYIPALKEKREARMREMAASHGVDMQKFRTMLRSAKSFAPMLEALGVEPPTKISKTNGKVTFAFAKNDPDFKDLLDHPDPRVVDLVETKIGVGSSQAETRAQRFLDIGYRGPLPMSLKPWGAHTGRWSGTQKINVQNLPARGADKTLRRSMIAPPNHAVATNDLAQIEARRLADIAGQIDLLGEFARGGDPYSSFATELYGRPVAKNTGTDTERSVGKECILSLGFGAGANSFRNRLKGAYGIEITEQFAQQAVDLYRRKNNHIKRFWYDCDEAVKTVVYGGVFFFGRNDEFKAEKNKVTLADGFILHYDRAECTGEDDLGRPEYSYYNREKRTFKKLYSGLMANNVTQASAGRILQWQMYNMRHESDLILRNTVHDEIITLPHLDELKYYYEEMVYHMKRVPDWAQGTPVDCEFECGWNYADQMPYEKFIEQLS